MSGTTRQVLGLRLRPVEARHPHRCASVPESHRVPLTEWQQPAYLLIAGGARRRADRGPQGAYPLAALSLGVFGGATDVRQVAIKIGERCAFGVVELDGVLEQSPRGVQIV